MPLTDYRDETRTFLREKTGLTIDKWTAEREGGTGPVLMFNVWLWAKQTDLPTDLASAEFDSNLVKKLVVAVTELPGLELSQARGKISEIQMGGNRVYVKVLIWGRVPPLPIQTIELPKRPIGKLAPSTVGILQELYRGADLRVFWRYHMPRATLNDKPIPVEWGQFTDDLATDGDTDFFDGYSWLKFHSRRWNLVKETTTYSDEDGVEEQVTLTDEGRKYVEDVLKKGV